MGASFSIVLVPGLLCDAAVWRAQHAALAPLAPVAIADHGLCDTLPAMARQALALCAGPIAVAGHSMGGRVALEMLRLAPDRIVGLALLDTGLHALAAGEAGERERAGRLRLLAQARSAGMRAMARTWAQDMVHPDRLGDAPLLDSILDMFARKTPAHFAAQIEALLRRPDAAGLLADLDGAGLALCGREDRWSAVPAHEDMAKRMRAGELVVIEHCGHMSTLEQPQAVTQALLRWVQRVAG
ncbi:MAG TPA: alpha/beta hydrolase [Steroidobacteraceae bacterium]|nr:alpha/beta hydrolase [Steroidobacteraceae bacterium]